MTSHSTQISTSTSDLRSHSQQYKRDAAHKHKWALGAVSKNATREGGAEGKAKPVKVLPTNTHNSRRRQTASALASSAAKSAKFSPAHPSSDEHPALSSSPATSNSASSSTSSYNSDAEVKDEDANITYTYDHPTGPVPASEILSAAMARAVLRFEEEETVRLVRGEWDVLDEEGEVVRMGKKGLKARKMVAPPSEIKVAGGVDEDWEVV